MPNTNKNIPDGAIGEVVEDGHVIDRQFTKINPLTEVYCWVHPDMYRKLENPQKFTEIDKKMMAKIRLTPFKTTDRFGKVTMGRSCPKCHNTVFVPDSKKVTIAT